MTLCCSHTAPTATSWGVEEQSSEPAGSTSSTWPQHFCFAAQLQADTKDAWQPETTQVGTVFLGTAPQRHPSVQEAMEQSWKW